MKIKLSFFLLILWLSQSCQQNTQQAQEYIKAKVTNPNGMVLFDSPEESARKVIKIAYQEELEIIEDTRITGKIENQQGSWLKVRYKNLEGYALNSFLTASSTNEETPLAKTIEVPQKEMPAKQDLNTTKPEIEPSNMIINREAAQSVIESYYESTANHEDISLFFTPIVTKFYLRQNITREQILETSKDWWSKMPYEEFNVLWNTAQYTQLSDNKFQVSFYLDYSKKEKRRDEFNTQRVKTTAILNADYQIVALY